jgi:hypothetical protein
VNRRSGLAAEVESLGLVIAQTSRCATEAQRVHRDHQRVAL